MTDQYSNISLRLNQSPISDLPPREVTHTNPLSREMTAREKVILEANKGFEMVALESKLRASEDELKQVKQQLSAKAHALQYSAQANKALTDELMNAATTNKRLIAENEDLRDELDLQMKEEDENIEFIYELRDIIQKERSQHGQNTALIRTLKQLLQRREDENIKLRDDAEKATKSMQDTEATFDELMADINTLKAQNAGLIAKVAASQARLEISEQQNPPWVAGARSSKQTIKANLQKQKTNMVFQSVLRGFWQR